MAAVQQVHGWFLIRIPNKFGLTVRTPVRQKKKRLINAPLRLQARLGKKKLLASAGRLGIAVVDR